MNKSRGFDTELIHAGYGGDSASGAMSPPLHRTTAYRFKDTDHAARLFGLQELGNIYTRLGNPTQEVLENRIATLEGGAAAVALASGTSAIHYAVINICAAGDELLASRYLYGGTHTMFDTILPSLGITVKFFDQDDLATLDGAVTERTRGVFVETVGNPTLDVADLESLAERAHSHGLPLIVDNTFATPYLCRPIEHGADVVVHSLTKWINGQGAGIGGVVVDAGKFDWGSGRFPLMSEPDPSYHGIRYAHDLGELGSICYALRLRLVPLRNLGASIAPDNAWVFLHGLTTLSLRMERHSSNALKVAEFLQKHPKVGWVRYPGLAGDPSHTTANKILSHPGGSGRGYGGMVVFGVAGGREQGRQFIDSLQLLTIAANVGDSRSMAIHPATTTHSQLAPDSLKAGGIGEDLVRLSIGIESPEDILEDLASSLEKI